jgi:hypothetical protein
MFLVTASVFSLMNYHLNKHSLHLNLRGVIQISVYQLSLIQEVGPITTLCRITNSVYGFRNILIQKFRVKMQQVGPITTLNRITNSVYDFRNILIQKFRVRMQQIGPITTLSRIINSVYDFRNILF